MALKISPHIIIEIPPQGGNYTMTYIDDGSVCGMFWGDKGCIKDTSKCDHPADDGCMWCCMQCNTDTHRCPNCGTVSDHKETMCGEKPEDCYTDLGGR